MTPEQEIEIETAFAQELGKRGWDVTGKDRATIAELVKIAREITKPLPEPKP